MSQPETDASAASIQERLYPSLTCFGCGHANLKGLRLRSYPEGEYSSGGIVTAHFTPWPEHDNGFGYVNGGIISTVLDCHSAAAVVSEAVHRGWADLPGGVSGGDLPYVTAALDVRFLRPTPLLETLELRGAVTASDEAELSAETEIVWGGKSRAVATTTWKRWRPR